MTTRASPSTIRIYSLAMDDLPTRIYVKNVENIHEYSLQKYREHGE
jgi:hypothetical protein